MGILSFFGFYGKGKVKEVAENITSKIVEIDPEGASEAQLNMMLDKLSEISGKVAQYQRAYEKDLQETTEVEQRINRAVEALGILQSDLESATGDRASEIGSAMDRLLDEVDKLQGELDRERAEDQDAEELLKSYRDAEETLAKKIREAKDNLKRVSSEIERAKVRREIAEDRLEAQKEASGLSSGIDSLNIASNYMEQELQRIQSEEEALKSQRELLSTPTSDSDDIIEQALKRAKSDDGSSRAERLKRLRESRGV